MFGFGKKKSKPVAKKEATPVQFKATIKSIKVGARKGDRFYKIVLQDEKQNEIIRYLEPINALKMRDERNLETVNDLVGVEVTLST